MNQIRKIILEALMEIEMMEAAVDAGSAAKLGMGVVEGDEGNLLGFILHDFSQDKNVGVIYLKPSKIGYEVVGVSADKGYGPLMYRIAMTRVYPKYIYPDRMSVTSAAASVWEKFMNDSRVEHIELDPEHRDKLHSEPQLNKMYRTKGGDFSSLEVDGIGDREFQKIMKSGLDRFESWLTSE